MASYDIVYAAGVLLLTRSEPRQFLLMRHHDRWDLPKGHAEAGECSRQTALREMTEETGIAGEAVTLEPGFRFRLVYPVSYGDRPGKVWEKRLTLYLGWVDSVVEIAQSEHEGFRWFPWQPPHRVQAQTIDPMLAAVAAWLEGRRGPERF